jgi:hypothetical protein
MQSSTDVEKSINFVWGYIGKQLQQLDKRRMLAIAQNNPNYHLNILANIDIDVIINDLFFTDTDIILSDNLKKRIIELNRIDNTFIEIAKFLKHSQDMLSTGSTITGQIDKNVLPLRIHYENKDGVI